MLLGSSVLETYSLHMAYRLIKQSAEEADMSVWQYIKRGRDPTTVGEFRGVKLSDQVQVLQLLAAGAGVLGRDGVSMTSCSCCVLVLPFPG